MAMDFKCIEAGYRDIPMEMSFTLPSIPVHVFFINRKSEKDLHIFKILKDFLRVHLYV